VDPVLTPPPPPPRTYNELQIEELADAVIAASIKITGTKSIFSARDLLQDATSHEPFLAHVFSERPSLPRDHSFVHSLKLGEGGGGLF
jgi:hypothetical protein